MAILIIMPKQGQSVESCIIGTINKQKGDEVKKGDVLFSYETDKATFEEESPADGTILEVFYNEGDEVPVLENMMVIGNPGEDFSDLIGDSKEQEAPQNLAKVEETPETEAPSLSETQDLKPATPSSGLETKFISPRAKNLAEKSALDVSQITGTGPKGRIIEKDVQEALANRPKLTPLAKKIAVSEGVQPQSAGTGLAGTAKAGDLLPPPINTTYGIDFEDKKITNMRKLIAKSMHASLQNSAQLTHHLGADARRILELRKQAKANFEAGKTSANITLNDMVCFAVIKALKKFPNVNSHFLGDTIRYFNKIHLALAVDTERGLMVPVVKNADDLSIEGLSNQFKELAAACRKGNVNPEILAAEAGTFTVSNLGNYGVEMFTPVINLPQSAILGVNTIVPRPKDLDDGVYAFVPYIGLSLTYDHRSLDGGEATRFLKQIAIEIENLSIEV
ncbi:MAG: 2-oxo acid dehydrogenase subunit E2 [Porphyromonadaceae bacterium]|nr:2-oxo acid dehydrogenase subunit E2 [Porphyromonadaceae bacterium]